MDGGLVGEALRLVRAGVDLLLSADLTPLASVEVTATLSALEVQRRRLAAVDHRLVAEVGERGVAGQYARCGTADLLVTLLRVSPGEAKARVAQAGELGPRREVTGALLPPVLPAVAAAVRAGEVSAAHVSVISRCLDRIPADIAYEAAPVAEAMLVEAARHQHPGALAKTAALLLARLDADGTEPHERDLERRRDLRLVKNGDGSSRPAGLLTPEVTAQWEAILDSLAAPVPAADGLRDERTAGQRRHDALGEAASRLLRSATLPAAGGVPVTVLVRTTVEDLAAGTRVRTTGEDLASATQTGAGARAGAGTAQTAHGDMWSMRQLILSACEAEIVPVIFNEAGAALYLGRTRRLASRAQRLALAARDGGCCFPGCDRPSAWTEVHHIIEWIDLGPTDIDNLCLLCRYHHREFKNRGWVVKMRDGVPEWLPPPFIDPERRPIRNTAHHPPDIEFALGETKKAG